MLNSLLDDLHWLDLVACGCFVLGWPLYAWFADSSRWAADSLPRTINHFRELWMMRMLERDARMMDLLIQSNLVHGIAFFASTAILLAGGALAALGASEKVTTALSHLAFAPPASYAPVEYKLLLLLAVFIYAFVKFLWAHRLANYSSILMGAAPEISAESSLNIKYAALAARVSSNAGRHFNKGLRANIFAVAVLGWFFHPVAFLVMTLWVIWLLYRREFRSEALDAFRQLRVVCEEHDDTRV